MLWRRFHGDFWEGTVLHYTWRTRTWCYADNKSRVHTASRSGNILSERVDSWNKKIDPALGCEGLLSSWTLLCWYHDWILVSRQNSFLGSCRERYQQIRHRSVRRNSLLKASNLSVQGRPSHDQSLLWHCVSCCNSYLWKEMVSAAQTVIALEPTASRAGRERPRLPAMTLVPGTRFKGQHSEVAGESTVRPLPLHRVPRWVLHRDTFQSEYCCRVPRQWTRHHSLNELLSSRVCSFPACCLCLTARTCLQHIPCLFSLWRVHDFRSWTCDLWLKEKDRNLYLAW